MNGHHGFVGGVCTSGAALPQIYHLCKTKSAKDFSWQMLGISSFGQCLWITHGAIQKDPAVLTFASFNLVVNAIFSIIKISTSEELQRSNHTWVKWFTVPALVPFPSLPLSSLPDKELQVKELSLQTSNEYSSSHPSVWGTHQ